MMSDFFQQLLNAALFEPQSVEPPDAWIGHIPFAAWLIGVTRPKLIVELGTHSGNSYFALCQAVKEGGVPAKVFAVDTWKGEEHAGYYGEDVFEKVTLHNRENYGHFSSLLRMTFDEALSCFADGSIDLLHIDGLHTYEAVRHDFESWRPKLAPGAVVLLHDSNERVRGFGVWKLWEELQAEFSHRMEFSHCHGLALLQLPGDDPSRTLEWLHPLSPLHHPLREYFAALGQRQMERFEGRQRESHVAFLHGELEARGATITELTARLAEQSGELQNLGQAVSESQTQLAMRDATINELTARLTEQAEELTAREATIAEQAEELVSARQAAEEMAERLATQEEALSDLQDNTLPRMSAQIAELEAAVSAHQLENETLSARIVEREALVETQREQIAAREEEFQSVLNSRSWRLTEPLRALKRGGTVQVKRLGDSVTRPLVRSIEARPALKAPIISAAELLGVAELGRRLYRPLKSRFNIPAEILPVQDDQRFAEWLAAFDTPDNDTMERWRQTANSLPPVLVLAFFDTESVSCAQETAQRLVDSVGVDWQALFVLPPGSKSKRVASDIRRSTGADSRIRFKPAESMNEAEVLVILSEGNLPRQHALRCLVEALERTPSACLVYADETGLRTRQEPDGPWFKPGFSQMLLEQQILLGGMVAVRPPSGSHSDFVATLTEQKRSPEDCLRELVCRNGGEKVLHLPHILSHRTRHLAPRALKRPSLNDPLPLVSIIVPTRDHWPLLEACLASLRLSAWPVERREVIVVDNGSTDPLTLHKLAEAEASGEIRLLRDDAPFNWSYLNNQAAAIARGELLVFLNNDTEVIDADWIHKLAAWALQPGVGAVGCKLLYPDRTVQHGGVVTGIQGLAGHAHLFLKEDEGGYCGLANITREVTSVTGACLAVTRENFQQVGGFDEEFRVAFNDTVFCLALHTLGRHNIYVADPLLIHHESKSRGYDDTPEKKNLLLSEATLARRKFPDLLRNDPLYSPNLCLTTPYQISLAPRRRPCWDALSRRGLRVMLLSVTHAVGHGVPVVLAQQAQMLVENGYDVIVAGPKSDRDHRYPGCTRLELGDPMEALLAAARMGVDVMVPHTPPFFSVAKWTGAFPQVIAYDHGEPPAEWFPDEAARLSVQREKDFCLSMTDRVVVISQAIAAESRGSVDLIVRNGNSHMGRWTESCEERRQRVRGAKGWEDALVVLNVCRFHGPERTYKGVDLYVDVCQALAGRAQAFDGGRRTVFVLCGKGTADDVAQMTQLGLHVEANVTDEEMTDLYCAADVYMNFSRWEGYNLGIGQALAMGLPVVASDIPAHREFGVQVTNEIAEACSMLEQFAEAGACRTVRVWEWRDQLAPFVDLVAGLPQD